MRHDVGIGEMFVGKTPGDTIKTYALGSCVAVMIYDKASKASGMIHIALPESKINAEKAAKKPGYFADTGIPVLLQKFTAIGGNQRRAQIKLAGGASIMDEKKTFDIGRRNVIAVKRALWKSGLGAIAEDVGGNISRTVSIDIESGKIDLNNAQKTWSL